jgi:DNA-binding Xre family transcriptional regulator
VQSYYLLCLITTSLLLYYFIFPNHLLVEMVSKADKEILIQFGKRLKFLRQTKKLTLRKMALLCNVEYADIQRYENGKLNITLLSISELAKALEVEPKDLLTFEIEA